MGNCNNDVIIDVKTFWRPFFTVFMAKRTGTVHTNCSYFKVTRTIIRAIIVNGCYWSTFMQARVY